MTYHWIIPLFAAVATLCLGVLVHRERSQHPVGQRFAVLACTLVFWNLHFFVLDSVGDEALAAQITRILRVGALFMPPAVLNLTLALRVGREQRFKWVLLIDYILAALLALSDLFGLVVADLRLAAWGYSSIGGPLYGVFSAFLISNLGGALGILARDYLTASEARIRAQLRFWLLGAAVAMPLGLTNLLPAFGLPVYPLGSLGNAVWAAVVAYAIVRHRLMDIDLVVSKSVAYFATGLLVITPAFSLTVVMQNRIFGSVHYDFSFALLVMFVAIGVLFPTLRLKTEAQVERALFYSKHQYRSVLASFAKSVIRILDRERLIREVADKLNSTLRVDRVAIFMRDSSDGRFILRHSIGVPPVEDEYPATQSLLKVLATAGEGVMREEVEAKAGQNWREAGSLLTANGWEVCVPLAASGSLIGFIGLGRKRDLDVFSVVDLDLLGAIAAQSAIALENARLYEELHKSRDIIQRAGRMSALGTLAAGIAHEIRNPLVSIQTFFQLAPERLQDEEFMTSFMGLAENEVKRIADLVTELLTFARSHPDAVQEVDLDDTIDRAVKLLSPQAHKHRVHLLRVGAHLLPIIRVDPDRVKQVLINIILNGIQATPENGTVTVGARLVEQRGRQFCQVAIHDTGPGIPAETQEDIFNPFFTTKDKGTGLGLSIAHQIITDHSGFITVESREGEGCAFFIHLPVTDLNPSTREQSVLAG